MFTCVLGARLLPQSHQYTNLSEGADRVGGQLRGDRVPLQWRDQIWQSLEEGVGKQCSERASTAVSGESSRTAGQTPSQDRNWWPRWERGFQKRQGLKFKHYFVRYIGGLSPRLRY